ncbi:MAG: RagB/SusD family nutrient uptake outer membrane protein [Prevotellaceae bacterium]|jgi:hypothetical protein|nr:RagB/SusD family nutrient uptake outer membrane protein [Prevotellaceae bacterium]
MKINKTRRIGRYFLPLIFLLGFSCSDYLDVVPDDIPTIGHAFNDRYEAERYLYGCFGWLPAFSDPGSNPAFLGGDEVWYIDPWSYVNPRLWYIARGAQGTNAPYADYWGSIQNGADLNGGKAIFTALNDCNIFLENIHKPYDLEEEVRIRWVAEAKFLKAFFHFWLFRMYGPIPLIKENLPLAAVGENARKYREPIDEVVEYILELLDEAIVDLPKKIEDIGNELGRPTKAIALALKAQTLVYAASPLLNGDPGKAPEFSLTDNRGVQLFPQTYSVEKWQKAAVALKEAIDEAHDIGHKLYDFKTSREYTASLNEKTVLAMQVRGAVTDRWNDEIVWGDPYNNPSMLQTVCFPLFATETSASRILAIGQSYAPTLQVVEQFYTENGVPIEDDIAWQGVDPFELRASGADDKWYVQQGQQSIKLHFNREPRFYGAISFDKGTFFGNGRINNDTNPWYVTIMGAATVNTRYSSTGYLCKKLIHSLSANTSSMNPYQYAFPIIRLADLYLLYAEALNEIGGPSDEVYQYIDTVRTRTGLEKVVDSWSKYAIDSKKNKPSTQAGLRDIIRRERLNELAFEGARFWDLRRWRLAEEYMNKTVRGFDMFQKTPADFYQVKEIYSLKFEKKDYLWPLSTNVLLRNTNLKQNPGW